MNIFKYLFEQRALISFFIILMVFICSVIYLDRSSRILDVNLAYILLVSSILFILFIVCGYAARRKACGKLAKLAGDSRKDWINNLPKPSNKMEKIYNDLLSKLYQESILENSRHEAEKREELEFITAWVHQIKTPIAAARLVIQNDIQNPSESTLLSIDEEVGRMEDFVNKALYYSRSNDFANDYLIDTVKLDRIVKESLKRHSRTFIGKHIEVVMENLEFEVLTDMKWIGFILDQLLSNSAKYTENGGRVRIFGEKYEDETVLGIEDNGAGIRPEDLGRVFDKSFTGFNGRTGRNSTGIGLYLSRRLARKLGHRLEIASEFGKGTKVSICFPRWNDYYEIQESVSRL